jgi:hypothetical protein
VTGSRSRRESAFTYIDTTVSTNTDEEHRRSVSEQVMIDASWRRYPWSRPFGISIDVSLDADYGQRWSSISFDQATESPSVSTLSEHEGRSEDWSYRYSVVSRTSIGWGRVRDATSVYDALVLEHRLRDAGTLNRSLSTGARRRVINLLYVQDDYDRVRDRPARSLWQEVEQILRDDGALSDRGLDAFSILRATEPLMGGTFFVPSTGFPTSPIPRFRGVFAGVAYFDRHSYELNRGDAESFNRVTVNGTVQSEFRSRFGRRASDDSDDSRLGASGEYHRPMGERWQLDVNGDALFPLRKRDKLLMTSAGVRLGFLVADRWFGSTSAFRTSSSDFRTDGPQVGDTWTWQYGARIEYYLENATSFGVGVQEHQSRSRGDSGNDIVSRNASAALWVSHRFAGRFSAPGLFLSDARVDSP